MGCHELQGKKKIFVLHGHCSLLLLFLFLFCFVFYLIILSKAFLEPNFRGVNQLFFFYLKKILWQMSP